ncbi:MAG: hypothetical protein ABL958_21785, partial [Bdellovibrionia bacterium]
LELAVNRNLFPSQGFVSLSESPASWLHHLVLPGLTLAALPAAEPMPLNLGPEISADEILAIADNLASAPKRPFVQEPLDAVSNASVRDLGFVEPEKPIEQDHFEFRKHLPSVSDFMPNELSVDLPPPPMGLQGREEQFKVVVRKPRLKV